MKIIHIVGNRPQFIKLALLNKALQTKNTSNIILHTGQHFDKNMSDIFFDELEIPLPDYTLDINSMLHNEMIGKMLTGIDEILAKENPVCAVVYGDTNTTLAGAIAAKKRNIPIAHIEAGVRTMDESMPEETNRYITDRISALNFCCTDNNVENLKKEGFFSGAINSIVHNCGDLMLDAVLCFKDIALTRAKLPGTINLEKPFVLTTIHRAENTENIVSLQNIIAALNNINQHTPVVFPTHPKTKALIKKNAIPVSLTMLDALGYLDSLALTQKSTAVITDSGGLCRESFFFKKPT